MAEDWGEDATRRAKSELVDASVPTMARIWDYLNGGKDNFVADRKAARALAGTEPMTAPFLPYALSGIACCASWSPRPESGTGREISSSYHFAWDKSGKSGVRMVITDRKMSEVVTTDRKMADPAI